MNPRHGTFLPYLAVYGFYAVYIHSSSFLLALENPSCLIYSHRIWYLTPWCLFLMYECFLIIQFSVYGIDKIITKALTYLCVYLYMFWHNFKQRQGSYFLSYINYSQCFAVAICKEGPFYRHLRSYDSFHPSQEFKFSSGYRLLRCISRLLWFKGCKM